MPILLDGTDDFITIANPSAVINSTNGTFSFWFNAPDHSQQQMFFWCGDGNANGYGSHVEMHFGTNFDGEQLRMDAGGSNLTSLIVDASDWDVDTWYQIACIWGSDPSGGNSDIAMYFNASDSLVSELNANPYPDFTATISDNCKLGRPGASTRFGNVKISELYVWDAILSVAEIEKLYSSRIKGFGRQIRKDNVTLYLPLDDVADGKSGDGVKFSDLSGKGNDGTGDDGANNTGLTGLAEEELSYEDFIRAIDVSVSAAVSATATPSLVRVEISIKSPTILTQKNAIATPTTASQTIKVFTPIVSVQNSAIGSPSISSQTIKVFDAITSISLSAIATPSLLRQSVKIFVPTVLSSQKVSVSPTLAKATITIKTATTLITKSAIATPDIEIVSIIVTSPTVSVKSNALASPALAVIRAVVNQVITLVTNNATGLPSLMTIKVIVNAPTIAIHSNRLASPGLEAITIALPSPIITVTSAGDIVITFVLESPIDKFAQVESRINKFMNKESWIDNNFVIQSKI